MSLNEVEQENFDAEEFVDRFARKSELKLRSVAEFESISLHTVFLKAIHDLKIKKSEVEKCVEEAEGECARGEEVHCARISQLLVHNQTAFEHLNGLDDRISFVASKVVHLGDQLQEVNIPRTRAAEAHLLINHFSHFLSPCPLPHFFNDPLKSSEAADVIRKLYTISQELPDCDKFKLAKTRITDKYTETEMSLIEKFSKSFQGGDIPQMKQLAEILIHFNEGYIRCVNVFIEESQKGSLHETTIFEDSLKLCTTMAEVIPRVFASPHTVVGRLVASVFRGRLQDSIHNALKDRSNLHSYLSNLSTLHQKTVDLAYKLDSVMESEGGEIKTTGSGLGEGSDGGGRMMGEGCGGMGKMVGEIYGGYLENYIRDEKAHLRERSTDILNAFYQEKGHVKKPVGGMRDWQNALNNTLHTLSPSHDSLMKEAVTGLLMDLFKAAFFRCQKLCDRESATSNTCDLFNMCVHVMVDEYAIYGLELALNALAGSEMRVGFFLDLVLLTNTFKKLFEKLFVQAVHPSLLGSSRVDECMRKRKEVYDVLEKKLELGVDRTLTSMAATIKIILSSEQKKGDFLSENSAHPQQLLASSTCMKVIGHLKSWLKHMAYGLDGKNLEVVQLELLVRFHRVLYEHISQFKYSSIGAMMLISDVNEYRKMVKEQAPSTCQLASDLFGRLHSLCNLLIVLPENLNGLCNSDDLSSLDKPVHQNFIQLRSDYKSAKLASYFR